MGTEREATATEAADAAVRATKPGQHLTAQTVALVMKVALPTLIRWLDARDPLAPPAIEQPGGRYRFRPAVLAPWLREHGYDVPKALLERAEREGKAA